MAAGRKTGGRAKGTPNKATAAREALVAAAGDTPLDYLLSVMRDADSGALMRLEAAKAAAPYVHPKLAAITHKGDDNSPVRHVFEWLTSESGES